MRVLVLGSTGYGGMMLLRILGSHPEVRAIVPVSRSSAGRAVRDVDPALGATIDPLLAGTDGRFVSLEDADAGSADVVFSALPHGAAARLVGPLAAAIPVIDLSADFRLADRELYESVYGTEHPHPELLDEAVYGLTEWYRDDVARANVIACPGCYPTATLLPLLPFADVVRTPAVVNAMSGISGAGRREKQDLLFNERSENANAYNPGRVHRHVPEIEQELGLRREGLQVLFTPHLVPMKQGMLVTTVAELETPVSQAEAERRIRDAYADSVFVGLSTRGIPQSRDVRNTNRCDIGVRVHANHVQLFSAVDNLYKGAAGQGVQNMNVRFGLPEHLGLRVHGEF